MSQTIIATSREEVGKGDTRKICKANGLIPAVIYGEKQPNINVYVQLKEINHAAATAAFHKNILDLELAGNVIQVTVQECQIHPNTASVRHVDFKRVAKQDAAKAKKAE